MGSLEIIGFITGIIGVWLTVRNNLLCFPVGLINVSLSLWLFLSEKLYADALQQAVYFALLVYGWWQWSRKSQADNLARPVTPLKPVEWYITVFSALGMTVLLGFLLDNFTDASLPWLDSFATSLAFIAQYLVARRKLENWYLWLAVNGIYILIYATKNLQLYMLLSIVYMVLAWIGLKQWKQDMEANHASL
jgi:nicotinamide mononucleotide transporter